MLGGRKEGPLRKGTVGVVGKKDVLSQARGCSTGLHKTGGCSAAAAPCWPGTGQAAGGRGGGEAGAAGLTNLHGERCARTNVDLSTHQPPVLPHPDAQDRDGRRAGHLGRDLDKAARARKGEKMRKCRAVLFPARSSLAACRPKATLGQ